MLSKRNRAATPMTAQKNIQQHESYRNPAPKSSGILKEKIGTLLLALQMPLNRKTTCLQHSIKPTLTHC